MTDCQIPKLNASSQEIDEILNNVKSIVVVGLSMKPDRPSHWIYQFLKEQGFNVVGVNPGHSEILGDRVYKSISDLPAPVDLVDLFVQSDRVPAIVEEAIAAKSKVIWMQEGIVNNGAADAARAAGLKVVMNKCIYKELLARGNHT